ncbi:MAG: putative type II secretion system protein E, partial [Candidatus Berkelbacteria bacterium Licking1014_2]
MAIANQYLAKVISERKILPDDVLQSALQTAISFRRPLQQILIEKGLFKDKDLGQLIADIYGVPFIYLKNRTLSNDILNIIPEKIAIANQCLPFAKQNDLISVAMTDPKNFELLNFLRKKTGLRISPYYILEDDLKHSMSQYKKNIKEDFANIIAETAEKVAEKSATAVAENQDLEKIANQLPIIQILDTIMEYAIAEKASDLHIETQEKEVMIRFRIDGVLHDIITLPKAIQ